MKHAYELRLSFLQPTTPAAADMLGQMQSFAALLPRLSSNLDGWMLGGNSLDEARRYKAFTNGKPDPTAVRVETEGFTNPDLIRIIQIWNGKQGDAGASIQYIWQPQPKLSVLTFTVKPDAFTHDWNAIADVMAKAALLFKPKYATLHSNGYWPKQVFKDRPGVGWMIYLDKTLAQQQVLEARALVPVRDGDKQIGTIAVSEIDGAFSDANADHVKTANDIEIRLADQDLLPRLNAN